MGGSGINCHCMKEISSQDKMRLDAAEGWILLEALDEAEAEWEALSQDAKNSLEGLKLRYWILSGQKKWEEAADSAQLAIAEDPREAQFWIWLAYAIRRKNDSRSEGITNAWKALIEGLKSGARDPIIFFNLACYACQMGSMEEARQWFKKACFQANSVDEIRKMALEESDLEPLWSEIREEMSED